jgi:anti-sigma factor RsiW
MPGPRRRRTGETALRTCRDILGRITEYLEGGLSETEIRRLREHLGGCGACGEFLESLRTTRRAVRGLRVDSIPEECRSRLRDFLRRQAGRRR